MKKKQILLFNVFGIFRESNFVFCHENGVDTQEVLAGFETTISR